MVTLSLIELYSLSAASPFMLMVFLNFYLKRTSNARFFPISGVPTQASQLRRRCSKCGPHTVPTCGRGAAGGAAGSRAFQDDGRALTAPLAAAQPRGPRLPGFAVRALSVA